MTGDPVPLCSFNHNAHALEVGMELSRQTLTERTDSEAAANSIGKSSAQFSRLWYGHLAWSSVEAEQS